MTNWPRLRKLARGQSGTAAIEFAFIAPVLILMGAGVYELGHGLQAQTALNELASQYAIAWADCVDTPAGTCNSELSLYSTTSAFQNLAPQLTASKVNLQMFQVLMTATTPTIVYSSGGGALSASQTAAAQAALTSGQSGVIVSVTYNFTLDFFPGALSGVVPSSIPMTFTVVQLKA